MAMIFWNLAALLLVAAAPGTSDWPRYQGPEGLGRTPPGSEAWDAESPLEVVWSIELGPGYGGAAIRDSEVYLLDRVGGERDVLRVFDLDSGEDLWEAGYDAPGRLNFPGSRTVPAVEEDLVYTAGGFGHITCFDRESREIVWTVDMVEEYQGEVPMFGYSASPIPYEDLLFVTPLGPAAGIVALDRFTGAEVWRSGGLGFSHSTPTIVRLHGEDQLVFLSTSFQASGQDAPAPTTLSSFAPLEGTPLWETTTTLTRLPVPRPIAVGEDRLFLTGGYRGGSTLLAIRKQETGYAFDTLFRIERGSQTHQPILHEDHLYVLVNENWNDSRARQQEGGLLCLGLDGVERWRTGDQPFFGRGNAILVGDHLLIQDGHSGVLRVVPADPEGYREVKTVNLFNVTDRRDHQMWAPMACSEGYLVLRSQEQLKCVRL